MDNLIVFTHIPKTSGTSFIKEIIEPNIGGDQIYRGGRLKSNITALQKDCKFLSGHFPYGLHMFTRKKIKYITFLREPIDRAVSFYFFVKNHKDNPKLRHPLYDYAESVTLKEFYQNKIFHNLQTRFIGGLIFDKLYPFTPYPIIKNVMLESAMQNLEKKYFCFGILEEREKSITLLQNKFALTKRMNIAPKKRSILRPRIDQVDHETIQILKHANDLDLQLYSFGLNLFKSKINETHQKVS